MLDREWKKLNHKIIGLIRQWIDDSVFHRVSMEVNAHSLWLKLKSLYEIKMAAFLIHKLVNMKYEEGVLMAKHLSNFQNMVNQHITMKMALDKEL